MQSGANVALRECRHGRMMFYQTDQYIGRSLDLYREFSELEADLFAVLLKSGAVAIDVGANVGAHTLRMARAVGPEGLVHAFEPQRALYYMLCGNMALNECSQVHAHHAAVGSAPGEICVPILNYASGGNFGGVSLAYGPWKEGESIPVVTLDNLGLKRCDFIKIDVEGMEREVLAGAEELLAELRPVLYVENDRPEKSMTLIQWLLDHSYRLFWHLTPLFNPCNIAGNIENVFTNIISVNMLGIAAERCGDITGLPEITSPTDTWRL
jgi:FkbM family methyltransferase